MAMPSLPDGGLAREAAAFFDGARVKMRSCQGLESRRYLAERLVAECATR